MCENKITLKYTSWFYTMLQSEELGCLLLTFFLAWTPTRKTTESLTFQNPEQLDCILYPARTIVYKRTDN